MWRRLPFARAPAAALLEGGLALLDELSNDPTPTLRWYRSEDTALVLGRGQQRTVVTADHHPVLLRHSGGGAVLLDPGLLCLDLVIPAGHPLLAEPLTGVFTTVGSAWAAALGDLGVPEVGVHDGPPTARRRGSARERILAAVCYATLNTGEVTAGGKKVVGLAQRRRRPGALVQCGLLRRWEPQTLLRSLGADAHDAVVRDAAVGIDDLMVTPLGDADIMATVEQHLDRLNEGAMEVR